MQRLYDLLTSAASQGHVRLVMALLEMGVDPNGINSSGYTAIQVVNLDFPEITQLLLDYGSNPNIFDSSTGRTPAHRAARNGSTETLIALLDGGAHIHLSDIWGHLPMDLASNEMVVNLQLIGILSDRKQHIMQDTMEN